MDVAIQISYRRFSIVSDGSDTAVGALYDIRGVASSDTTVGTPDVQKMPSLSKMVSDGSKGRTMSPALSHELSVRRSVGAGVASASAFFISSMPVTAAIRRTPLQIFLLMAGMLSYMFAVRDVLAPSDCETSYAASAAFRLLYGTGFVTAGCLGFLRKARWGVRVLTACWSVMALANVTDTILTQMCDDSEIHNASMIQLCVFYASCIMFSSVHLGMAATVIHRERNSLCCFGICGCFELVRFLMIVAFAPPGRSSMSALAVACILMSLWAYAHAHRHVALHRAWKSLQPDRARYDKLWQELQEREKDALEELARITRGHKRQRVQQPHCDAQTLFCLAEASQEWYQEQVGAWANELLVQQKTAKLKKPGRALEKAERSYHGDISRVLDFVRSSIAVDNIVQAMDVIKLVTARATVRTIKNRYDPRYDATATAGYRDINLQLSFPQLQGTDLAEYIFELQIIIATFLEVKSDEGHQRYVECRNIRGD